MIKSNLFILVLLLSFFNLNAQNNSINVLTTSTPFLRLSPDARSSGMGEVSLATSPDVNAVFYNQSKIAFAKDKMEFGFNYIPWLSNLGFDDVKMLTLSGYYKISERQGFTSSFRYFSLGAIPLSDYNGNLTNVIYPKEFSLDFGYAATVSKKLSVGVALRYIYSRLASGISSDGNSYNAGKSVSGDFSVTYKDLDKKDEGLTIGFVLSNIGSKIRYQIDPTKGNYLPANMGLGFVYKKNTSLNTSISLGVDFNKLLVPQPPLLTGNNNIDSAQYSSYRNSGVISSYFKSFSDGFGLIQSFQISSGLEFSYDNTFFARTGYFYEPKEKGDRKYFSIGSGIKYKQLTFNLAYLFPSGNSIHTNPLTNSLKLGIIYSLSAAN